MGLDGFGWKAYVCGTLAWAVRRQFIFKKGAGDHGSFFKQSKNNRTSSDTSSTTTKASSIIYRCSSLLGYTNKVAVNEEWAESEVRQEISVRRKIVSAMYADRWHTFKV